jgi:AAA-like domain
MDGVLDLLHLTQRSAWVAWHNIVVGAAHEQPWAVYRIGADRAGGPREEPRRTVPIHLLLDCLQADLRLLRVARPWSVEDYAMGFEAVADVRYANREQLRRYVREQCTALRALRSFTVELFLAVSLPSAPPDGATEAMLSSLQKVETRAHQRLVRHLEATRVSSSEIALLVRRAFRRGLPEPASEEPVRLHQDRRRAPPDAGALHLEAFGESITAIALKGSSLRVESEVGQSHQSFLRVEGLRAAESGARRKLDHVFAGLDAVEFPTDAALVANRAQPDSTGGCTTRSLAVAEEVEPSSHEIAGAGVTLSLAVSAPSAGELERRVVRLRRELTGIRLGRPSSEQSDLFAHHLPCGPARHSKVRSGPSADQLESFPPARAAIGSRAGPYLGYTTTGAPRPVLFDPFEAQRTGAPVATLLSGAEGSGKTLCMQLIMYHAFLAGAAVIDIDTCGDHALERLPHVAQHTNVLELSAVGRFQGLLDPLRIAPADDREQLAYDFLVGLIRPGAPNAWCNEIAKAVRRVVRQGGQACGTVVSELCGGSREAQDAAEALTASAAGGLAALGFDLPSSPRTEIEPGRVTILRLRGRQGAAADAHSSGHLWRLTLRLLAAYALHLAGLRRERQCVVGIDGATSLLADPPGRALAGRLAAQGKSGGLTPLLATRAISHAAWISRCVGTGFHFRVQNDHQARQLARLLEAEPAAGRLASRLLDAGAGRCVMRDCEGRVGEVQIEFIDDRLLPTLDTSPTTSQGVTGPQDEVEAADQGSNSGSGELARGVDRPLPVDDT